MVAVGFIEMLFVSGMILIVLVAVIGGLLVSGIKALRGNGAPKERTAQLDETRLIQEIHQSLARMEERVESLETIMMDRDRKDGDT